MVNRKVERLTEQRKKIETLISLPRFGPDFKAWMGETSRLIESIWGLESSYYKDFKDISYSSMISIIGADTEMEDQEKYLEGLETASKILETYIKDAKEMTNSVPIEEPTRDIDWILDILRRFDYVARQLRRRHASRETLVISDEYDVQDLLHALLKLRFDDIRPEEWTPSYAGASSRIDFLLKGTGIVIEVKMTRDTLKEKEIGEQLIVDIAKYQKHEEAERLICFVYDPAHILQNPYGLARDLTGDHPGLSVSVFIYP